MSRTPLLMPEPAQAEALGLTDHYPTYRVWWANYVLGLCVPEQQPERPTDDAAAQRS